MSVCWIQVQGVNTDTTKLPPAQFLPSFSIFIFKYYALNYTQKAPILCFITQVGLGFDF